MPNPEITENRPALPETIGPYRVRGLLGRRHPGTAYQATAPDGRAVVVEVMPPALAAQPEAAQRFHREVERLAGIEHANVLAYMGSGEDDGRLYLVREPWEGPALADVLAARRPSLKESITVFRGILKGLGQAHQRGIVHRDLSPTTVLVSPDLAQVKLAGFGLGKADALGGATGTLSTGEVSLANIYYLSPEQAEGKPADARSDLYSAGVLFHQLLTGRPPSAKFGLPSQLAPELPPEVDTLVLKCLARKPEERYSNVPHLLADLARLEEVLNLRLLSQLQGISRSTSRLLGKSESAEGAAPGGKKSPALLWGGIAAAVVLLALVAFLLLR
jgi:eukaryotic-like serine/threonine-protein kinase